jgi:hypothetical protein
LLYARNGMTTAEKFEAIQSLFTEISDYARTGKRTGLRSFHDAVADWTDEFDERCKPNGRSRACLPASLRLMICLALNDRARQPVRYWRPPEDG